MQGLGRLSVSDTEALSFDGFSRVGRIWSYGVGLVVLYLIKVCIVHYRNSTLFAYNIFSSLTLEFNFYIYLAQAFFYSPVNLDR